MKVPMNAIIGKTMIQNTAQIPDIAAIIPPVGSVALVTLVALAVKLAATGIAPLISDKTALPPSPMYRPVKNAKIALIHESIRAKDFTGSDLTTSPSIPNLMPPTLGANRL